MVPNHNYKQVLIFSGASATLWSILSSNSADSALLITQSITHVGNKDFQVVLLSHFTDCHEKKK